MRLCGFLAFVGLVGLLILAAPAVVTWTVIYAREDAAIRVREAAGRRRRRRAARIERHNRRADLRHTQALAAMPESAAYSRRHRFWLDVWHIAMRATPQPSAPQQPTAEAYGTAGQPTAPALRRVPLTPYPAPTEPDPGDIDAVLAEADRIINHDNQDGSTS